MAARSKVSMPVRLGVARSRLRPRYSPSPSQDLGKNDAVLIDAKEFKVVKGRAKGDTSSQIIPVGSQRAGTGCDHLPVGRQALSCRRQSKIRSR